MLDAWFPDPEMGAYSPSGTARLDPGDIPEDLAALCGPDADRGVAIVAIRTVIADLGEPRPTPSTPTCACTCSPID